jgi:hypothetical protein
MNSSFYSSSIKELVDQSPETILGHLVKHNSFSLEALQRNAWLAQISILQRELIGLASGWVAFEFAIPRMGKRVDNVILFGGVVFVLEFKVGSEEFDNSAKDQVIDYALDLKNFHSGSHDRPFVPIVVATAAPDHANSLTWAADKVAQPILSNGTGLGALINDIAERTTAGAAIDVQAWISSGYKPTPCFFRQAATRRSVSSFRSAAKNTTRPCFTFRPCQSMPAAM